MTRLSDVVRGVEVKKEKGYDSFNPLWSEDNGYNSLASAEVVVDREKMAREICEQEVIPNWAEEFGLETSAEMDVALAKMVSDIAATAIESGAVISLKKGGKDEEKKM